MDKIVKEIIEKLSSIDYEADIGDIGNEIGLILGKHTTEKDDINSFFYGVEHGIELAKKAK
jgi:hypothetical protein